MQADFKLSDWVLDFPTIDHMNKVSNFQQWNKEKFFNPV